LNENGYSKNIYTVKILDLKKFNFIFIPYTKLFLELHAVHSKWNLNIIK